VRFHSFYAMTEAGAITHLDAGEQFTHATSVATLGASTSSGRLCGRHGGHRRGRRDLGAQRRAGHVSTMREYFRRRCHGGDAARRLGRHGDVGRFDVDGYLYLMDRKKDMVLSGGYNIYSKKSNWAAVASAVAAPR